MPVELAKSTLQAHREAITLALCHRDYSLMAEHHGDILDQIESAVNEGVTPADIKRWASGVVSEEGLVQRVYNAARWYADGAKR